MIREITITIDNQWFKFRYDYQNEWSIKIEGYDYNLYIDEIKEGKLSDKKTFDRTLSDELRKNIVLYRKAVEKLEQYLLLI